MKKELYILNLKCSGCKNQIKKSILAIAGVEHVEMNSETDALTIHYQNEAIITEVLDKLNAMGYPTDETNNSIFKKAKSVVSCAIGRMSDSEKSKKLKPQL